MLDRIKFFITYSLNDLQASKQRSLFAILCIAAGVATIVSLQTLAVMINDTLTGSLQESNQGDLRLIPDSTWPPYIKDLDDALFDSTVFTRQGIAHIYDWFDEHYPGTTITYRQPLSGFGTGWSVYVPERDTDKTFVLSFIIEADTYPVYGEIESLDGKALQDMLQGPNDIVLGENLADDLDAQVGDTVRIAGASEDFVLRGIVSTDSEAGFRNSGMGFLAGLFGFYYLDVSATDLFEGVAPGQGAELYIRLDDPSKVDEVQTRFEQQFWAIDTASTTDLEEQNSFLSERVDDLVVIMGLVSLLIGGIGIINTMLVIVSRRTLEVAVLKTLGLQPVEVTILFLVEALMMGVIGSLAGILGGWGLAYLTKGFAENFLGQSLVFTIALNPAVNGFVVGLIITAIFGFLPTLAAGQVRPAGVLRPSETVIPRAGRFSAFVAVVCLVMALSLVAQGLLGDLLDSIKNLEMITTGTGTAYGVLIAVPLVIGDLLALRRRRGRRWLLHVLVWPVLLTVLPVGGALFGYSVPALLLLTGTAVLVGYLYILFWLVIWAVGGGRFSEIWPGILVLLFPAFWPLIPILIVILLPVWGLGRLIQRLMFIDFKIAMRGMLSTKGRGASTVLALVIGIFTLSVITMLVDTITTAFESLLEDVTGGNLLIFTVTGSSEILDAVNIKLDEEGDNLRSYAMVATYDTRLTQYWDASANRPLATNQQRGISGWFNSIDGRQITSNLPALSFTDGRNLDPAQDSAPDAEGRWAAVVQQDEFMAVDVGVGDVMTFEILGGSGRDDGPMEFVVVGVAEQADLVAGSEANLYAPLAAFEGYDPTQVFAVADVRESELKRVRRSVAEVPGTFVIETRFVNDLVNRLVDQFTSFPILVAILALFTGGFVIANSVALSTMERRREIGVMKAVGLQRERVLGMLLLENGLVGVIGGLIGVGISFVIMLFILYQMFEGDLGDKIPYGIAFVLMGLCILISLVAAIASVWTASGEKPLNTLRYE